MCSCLLCDILQWEYTVVHTNSMEIHSQPHTYASKKQNQIRLHTKDNRFSVFIRTFGFYIFADFDVECLHISCTHMWMAVEMVLFLFRFSHCLLLDGCRWSKTHWAMCVYRSVVIFNKRTYPFDLAQHTYTCTAAHLFEIGVCILVYVFVFFSTFDEMSTPNERTIISQLARQCRNCLNH